MPADAVELIHEFVREQIVQAAADGSFASDAGQLLHLGVPTLHPVFQVSRQDADVDGFDDVLAELFEPLVLLDLAGQRTVEARILDGDGYVAGQRQ